MVTSQLRVVHLPPGRSRSSHHPTRYFLKRLVAAPRQLPAHAIVERIRGPVDHPVSTRGEPGHFTGKIRPGAAEQPWDSRYRHTQSWKNFRMVRNAEISIHPHYQLSYAARSGLLKDRKSFCLKACARCEGLPKEPALQTDAQSNLTQDAGPPDAAAGYASETEPSSCLNVHH